MSALNIARDRILQSTEQLPTTNFCQKLNHLGRLGSYRSNKKSLSFVYREFNQEEMLLYTGEFYRALLGIASTSSIPDDMYWNTDWKTMQNSTIKDGNYKLISNAARSLVQNGCYSGSSSNLKINLSSEKTFGNSFKEELGQSNMCINQQSSLEQRLDGFSTMSNKQFHGFVTKEICPNHMNYSVIWRRDIGFEISHNGKDKCAVVPRVMLKHYYGFPDTRELGLFPELGLW